MPRASGATLLPQWGQSE
uniref:Uncharacterized protein n=1 Tax=Anguilla anguilla TaxID=7936 RepID=A0A0E9TKE4_ANGAN